LARKRYRNYDILEVKYLSLLVILAAILSVFILAFLASTILTRLSGAGDVEKVELGDLVAGRIHPGSLVETTAEVKLLEFHGLDTPRVLILTGKGVSLQAVDPEGSIDDVNSQGTSLMPSDPDSMTGAENCLGVYRLVGTMEDLPIPHMKIRAAGKN
jgi:hypothetical protein